METILEEILIYGSALFLCGLVIILYIRKQIKKSKETGAKIEQAKLDGLYEPVSLHPVVDPNSCIRTGACISACPEKDILGIQNGKATTINASQCIGHGACFQACPTQAITLCIGTETRGVDLPHITQSFETNIEGIYIAGELGGMGLIKNAVEQGKQATENLIKTIHKNHKADYDLIIIGAGPAGISASLTAKKHNINFKTLDQDTLGGTVYTFPRSKLVMTAPLDLPLHGKVKLFETSKPELLSLWESVLNKHNIKIQENTKVDKIEKSDDYFQTHINNGEIISSNKILLAIGRRGTPRKLGIEGENSQKVAYRLLEPEEINGKKIIVVGGGDSAIESAMLLMNKNDVILSYRRDSFNRIKPKNAEMINDAIQKSQINVQFKTQLKSIEEKSILLSSLDSDTEVKYENDLVYIFAGGELPTQFLEKAGIRITKKHGESILKHN